MALELNTLELRIIGCLIEKEITTPDQYPLSLNALVNACNQKSNRDPVFSLDEATVQEALDGLRKKHMVLEKSGFGSRVSKYQHRFCNTEFSDLKFTGHEIAILCELFLRGPQTPGELRARAGRMSAFKDVHEVEQALEALRTREGGPLVIKLQREPGKRESRYAHLFGGEVDDAVLPPLASAPGDPNPGESERIAALEAEVAALRAALETLQQRFDALDR